jgi:hypothetical protein
MIEETKKSIQSILSQRVSSPFYGTLIISWLIWNWKIIYLTLFISEKKITESKIDFIVTNYSETTYLLWFPLLSTIILLTIVPFITNGAYWLDLVFNNWRENTKNTIERKQLLTIEQSIVLREQIVNMEKRFDSLLADKNSEIEQMKLIINNYNKTGNLNGIKRDIQNDNTNNEIQNLINKIKENEQLRTAFKIIDNHILGGYTGLIKVPGITPDILSFYVSNELIESLDQRTYKWTNKGKQINKIISNETFNYN